MRSMRYIFRVDYDTEVHFIYADDMAIDVTNNERLADTKTTIPPPHSDVKIHVGITHNKSIDLHSRLSITYIANIYTKLFRSRGSQNDIRSNLIVRKKL